MLAETNVLAYRNVMTELTPPEHPKFAIARGAVPIRRVIAIAIASAALGFLLVVKMGKEEEKAEIIAAKQADDALRVQQNAAITQTLATAYGGESKDAKQRALVERVGHAITEKSDAKTLTPSVKFHLLAEPNSINIYALSTGDVYLTTALVNRMQTEGQLAAILAHGAAHAIPGDRLAEMEVTVGAQPQWSYSAREERKADALAVKLMAQAGYDPTAMLGMFAVLINAYEAGADVAFFTTHPNESTRLGAITESIKTLYPNGIPAELSK